MKPKKNSIAKKTNNAIWTQIAKNISQFKDGEIFVDFISDEKLPYIGIRSTNYVTLYKDVKSNAEIEGFISSDNGLPENFEQLRYISNVNNGYILTDYRPNNNTRIICEFSMPQKISGSANPLFGTNLNDGRMNVIQDGSDVNSRVFGYGNTNITLDVYNIIADGNKHTLDFNKNNVYLDSKLIATFEESVFQSTDYLSIFTLTSKYNDIDFLTKWIGHYNLYSMLIEENGVVVHKYVPSVDIDNKIGLYDTKTGGFYTSENSDLFVAGKLFNVPSGYTGKEYIRCTGKSNSYGVNLKFTMNFNNKIVCKFNADMYAGTDYIEVFGAGTGDFMCCYFHKDWPANSTAGGVEWGKYSISRGEIDTSNTFGKNCVISISPKTGATLYSGNDIVRHVDWGSKGQQSTGTNNYKMALFTKNKSTDYSINGDWKSFIGNIYYFKVYDVNDELIHYFVPCTNSSSKKGVYDLITDTWCPASNQDYFNVN